MNPLKLDPQQMMAAQSQNGWMRWLPGVVVLRQYQGSWLPKEIAAGLVLATMLIPVGMAYAVASGVPGIYGRYATIVPLLAYAVFLLCGVRPRPHSAPGAGFVPGRSNPGCRPTPLGRRPAASGGAGRHDGDCLGRGLHPGRNRAARVCDRTALQADPLRLHERN